MSLETLLDVGRARLRISQARTTGRPAPSLGSLAFDWAVTLLSAAIFTAPVLLVLRDRRLPSGALSIVFTLNATAMGVLFDVGSCPWPQVLAQSAAGAAADGLLLLLRPHADRVRAWRAFAFSVTALLQLAYFGSLLLTDGI